MTSPFLTDFDSRAAVKGSRDPLGIQSIWTRVGRNVIGNLSTVSNSVRDFTVLILGYHFAEQVAEKVGPGADLETFLKWEQMAGYARASVNSERGFRGTERVWRKLAGPSATLSAEPRHQILSSQKLYGLWGLYSVPARSSGLLDRKDPARLTVPARELVDNAYLPMLTAAGFKNGSRIVEMLAQKQQKLDVKGVHRALLAAIAGLVGPQFTAPEREVYRYHLLHGGSEDSTGGRQQQLAALLEPLLSDHDFQWTTAGIRGLAKEAERKGTDWQTLAHHLRRIAAVETVLAPASVLFNHLLGCDDVKLDELTKRIRQTWGMTMPTVAINEIDALQNDLAGAENETGVRWLQLARVLSNGDYTSAIRLMLEQNRAVMAARGGAIAWIEEQGGKLHVRMTDERGALPPKSALPTLWRFPYFLDSLRSVALALSGDRHV